MAWREALRDFYSRIAQRLQAADTARTTAASWLAVQVAGRPCLLPLAHTGEIFPAGPILPLPYTRSWFLGVANLRGELHGVIDLARFLALPPGLPAPGCQQEPVAGGWFVALHPAMQTRCALRIDRLEGVRPSREFGPALAVPRVPDCPPGPGWAQAFHVDAAGTSWLALDLQALVRTPEFLDAGI